MKSAPVEQALNLAIICLPLVQQRERWARQVGGVAALDKVIYGLLPPEAFTATLKTIKASQQGISCIYTFSV